MEAGRIWGPTATPARPVDRSRKDRANAKSLVYIVRKRTGSWPPMPFLVAPAFGRVGQENRRRFWPLTPRTPRTAAAVGGRLGLVAAPPYATLRVYRKALPSGRASPASILQASLLHGVLLARRRTAQTVCGSPGELSFFETMETAAPLEPQDRGRGRGRVPGLPGEAAHSGGRPWRQGRQGTAQPWIRRRSFEHVETYAPAPAFAELAGFAAKNQERFPASHARDRIGLSACGG